jgi:serine/threonine protein kinase
LNHPGIAGIYGVEEINGRHFLIMELVPGETLADRIKGGAIPGDEALLIAKQIAEALEAAHEKGIGCLYPAVSGDRAAVSPEGIQ